MNFGILPQYFKHWNTITLWLLERFWTIYNLQNSSLNVWNPNNRKEKGWRLYVPPFWTRLCLHRLHVTESSTVTLSRKLTRNPRSRVESDPRLGIGVCVLPRFRNPHLPPRQFERSFGTKHMEWLSANRWSGRAVTEGEAAALLLIPHQSLRGNLNDENEI